MSDVTSTLVTEPPETEDAPAPEATSPGQRSWWRAPAVILVAVIGIAVAVNLWWIVEHRRGLPLNIDEAGYLQRAIRNSDALHAGGLSQLVHVVRGTDPQAPLLPVTAGVVHYLTGIGPYGLLAVAQVFAVVLAVATYVVARRLMSTWLALLSCAVVVTLPGILDQGRAFGFAIPAAAALTATLAAQLYAQDFRSTPKAVLWGALLGIASLSRTMALSLIAALVLAGLLRVLASGPQLRKFVNFGVGLLVGAVIGWSWYSASWHSVLKYLTSYGYGANAASYGPAHSVWTLAWWTARLEIIAKDDLYLPFTLVLGLCVVAAIVAAIVRRTRRSDRAEQPTARPSMARLRQWVDSDLGTVVLYLALSYLVLSSSRNEGWGFEVPLLAPLVIVVLAMLQRVPKRPRQVVAIACGLVAAFALVAESGLLPGSTAAVRAVGSGSSGITVFDSAGQLVDYADSGLTGCAQLVASAPGHAGLGCDAYLKRWNAVAQRGANTIWSDATARGRLPVVALATQDRFFNTNTLDLDYQLAYHQELPTALLEPATPGQASLAAQLDSPMFSQPNLVIVGPASTLRTWRKFSPFTDPRPVVTALRQAGFGDIGQVKLPDGRVMQLWWVDRGPVADVQNTHG